MYCSQCGKKVMENMLFCPFCGSPIVIPDQEECCTSEAARISPISKVGTERKAAVEAVNEESAVASECEPAAEKPSEFVPLDIESVDDEEEDEEAAPEKDLSAEVSELLAQQLQQESVRLQGLKPDLRPASQFGAPRISSPRKNADTFIPQRSFDPDDMFMDNDDEEEDYEDYDDYDYDYEDDDEQEDGAFWVQHIRGLVALILLMSVAAVLVGWSFSNSGQQALARADLAWRPSAYAEIAYDAYQKGNYSQAGGYYSKAVARDTDNYDYASSASIAYYMAQDMQNAETLARLAIQIDPSKTNAYDLLLRLYPDSASWPEEIRALFQKGYELTGDSRLIAVQ